MHHLPRSGELDITDGRSSDYAVLVGLPSRLKNCASGVLSVAIMTAHSSGTVRDFHSFPF